jgi:DNA invertase Pin-like site-specific DNA recombinase
MILGYARVCTPEEDIKPQRKSLIEAGCREIFEDQGSANCVSLPGFSRLQASLKRGDTLVVWKLDRFGCSVKKLEALLTDLRKRGVHLRSLRDGIDTRTGKGRSFCEFVIDLANMERELALERTLAGREVAKKTGRTGGRRRQMTDSKILHARKLLASGMPPSEAAMSLGVSLSTLYRWIPAPSKTIQSRSSH